MLNEAFRSQNISILYRFRFFIKDLHMHLEYLHSLYDTSSKQRQFSVYRGLNMPFDVFKKTIRDEAKNLIAFDSFLSTTSDIDVAKYFALRKHDPKHESVLFHIEIDADRMKRPFANISGYSHYKTESEILFSIGTVFRIDDVATEKDKKGIWLVHLSTISEDDEQLQKETQQIQKILLDSFEVVLRNQNETKDYQRIPASNANVASMFYKQGDYENSLKYYELALKALEELSSSDPLTKATYINNIVMAHMALGHNNKALELYEKVLDIRRNNCQDNDPSLIHTLHAVSHIYFERKNWTEALALYKEALKRQLSPHNSILSSDPSSIAATYIWIGLILIQQQKYSEAIEAFEKALELWRTHLSEDHPVLAFLYNNIGVMYYKTRKFDLALTYHEECLKIETKSLPKDHETFAETYRNLATTYEKLQQYDKGIEFAEKCINQLKLHLPEDHPDLNDAMKLLETIIIRRDNTK